MLKAADRATPPAQTASVQTPLWQQLQGAAALLLAVRAGRSMTAELERVPPHLRPGVQALGFHALRWLGRAEALRQQLASRPPPPEADALLCVALALASEVDESMYTEYTLVDQAVEAAKQGEATQHQASFINGCLRRFLRERAELLAVCERKPQAVWNHPQWWVDRVRKDHPDVWQSILQANNSRPLLTLRVNTRQTTRADYLLALQAAGIDAEPVGAQGILLAGGGAVTRLPGYADGHFSVQDAGAQLAAPLLLDGLQASSGQPLRLLDACAAPGGKTAHLLELADAELLALDMDAQRCQRITQNLARLQLQARIVVADAGQPDAWWDGQLFDGILLDAPCTASGIVRRHPDVRWLRRPGDIAQLAAQQKRLLEALWPLVRPGGRLLYCTCSVFRAEGQAQIETFLMHHTDALLRPSPGHLLPQSGAASPVFPDNLLREYDGFYYALLEKRPA
jgi:16S rRNA (cytosine967-C5)-methyltransferase